MFPETIPRVRPSSEWWEAIPVLLLFLLCGILAGFAAHRFAAARASMRALNTAKRGVGTVRKTAWRHTGLGVLFIGGLILALYVVGRLGG
jgi:hypothetical protein